MSMEKLAPITRHPYYSSADHSPSAAALHPHPTPPPGYRALLAWRATMHEFVLGMSSEHSVWAWGGHGQKIMKMGNARSERAGYLYGSHLERDAGGVQPSAVTEANKRGIKVKRDGAVCPGLGRFFGSPSSTSGDYVGAARGCSGAARMLLAPWAGPGRRGATTQRLHSHVGFTMPAARCRGSWWTSLRRVGRRGRWGRWGRAERNKRGERREGASSLEGMKTLFSVRSGVKENGATVKQLAMSGCRGKGGGVARPATPRSASPARPALPAQAVPAYATPLRARAQIARHDSFEIFGRAQAAAGAQPE